jgi:malate synthase
VATAEISRSQIWQWVHHRAATTEGEPVTEDLVEKLADQTLSDLGPTAGPAAALFRQVALTDPFTEFLTIPAYQLID